MQSQPQPQLCSLIRGQVFEGYLLVKSSEQRTSSNGSKYLDVTLGDLSCDINGKMWDGTVAAPRVGVPVKVRAMMQEYNNRPQLRIDKLRSADDSDIGKYDMNLLIQSAPESADDMYYEIMNHISAIKDAELRAVVEFRLNECGDRLMYYPAAQRLHHAERAGLLHHTITMLRSAMAICQIYPMLDADLLSAGVILHDLCKVTEMSADELGVVDDYTREGLLIGHLVEGVSKIARACEQLGVRDETRMMLSHMILSHHDLPEYGSPRRPMFPEAEVLHIIDLLDARMFEMNQALSGALPGGFTEKIWSLERKLYRREKK